SEYLLGRTPNPCVRCNKRLKFDALLKQASNSGVDFDFFVTGHYAKVRFSTERKRYVLSKAIDGKKDQSYFLYSLSQEQLSRVVFPIGGYTKQQVRDIAVDLGLKVSDKAESQDFADVGYDQLMGGFTNPGPIINTQGEVLGQHRGIVYYTVGQRRGLRIPSPHPLYVIALDYLSNSVVVGCKSEVWAKGLIASGMNWIAFDELDWPIYISAKVRSTHEGVPAQVTPLTGERVHVEFENEQMAIAPGQAVVFYDGDDLVGGGTIDKAQRSETCEVAAII
ncbi:MAG: aminomethyltransferase beta-barrel domain-containing protein, partial [Chloroflexota bacterium]|nr:aminomethyltransferase beta-barrel domain-containing protein [Chloroflexota bacterium]